MATPQNKSRKDLNRIYGSTGAQDVDTETQDRQLLVDDAGRPITKQADAAGTIINPRKEDGHGSAAGTPTFADVVDRDARLLGRAKQLDTAGAVIDPATRQSVEAVTTSLGTDGAAPPAIAGTGVRGWLRAIYDKLLGTLQVDVTDEDGRILGRAKLLDQAGAVINPRKEDGHGSTAGNPSFVDVTDEDARILGRTKVMDSGGTVVNPRKEDGHGATSGNPTFVDVVDEDARILGRAKLLDTTGTAIDPATKQAVEAVTTSLGTDGAAPPAIAGTGVRGWLRAIYDRLLATLSVANIPSRASAGAGRTYKTGMLAAQTADQLLYTVTVGKKLYVTSLIVGILNTATGANAQVVLRDGTTAAGTAVMPFLGPPAGAGVLSSAVGNVTTPIALAEPLEITTGLFVDIVSGTITYSISFIGYEE